MLGAVLNKSWKHHTTKQQLYGHLPLILWTIQNKMSKTYWAQQEKQGLIHKWCSLVNSSIWTHQCYLTSKKLNISTLCRYWMQSREFAKRWWNKEESVIRLWLTVCLYKLHITSFLWTYLYLTDIVIKDLFTWKVIPLFFCESKLDSIN